MEQKNKKITYKDAGVDVHAGYEAVRLMKEHTKKTFNAHVLTDLGSFGGMFEIGNGDVLVSGTDGVGTKLKAAFVMDKHDTIGIDCVAMCVNDIVCHGAKPLFFLDYIATGKLRPHVVADIVKGVANGCIQSGSALIGGETAEMPDFYQVGEYDLAGFAVGIVKKEQVINGSGIQEGDVLIGLRSSGIHSNGFSLVRKVYPMKREMLSHEVFSLGKTLGEELLTPTRIYVKTILELIEKYTIKGIAHITGGGFIENIPRMIPAGLAAKVDLASYELPEIFRMLVADAGLEKEDAYNTFNMGIGMVLAVSKEQAGEIAAYINEKTEDTACILGEIVKGEGVILA